MDSHTLAPADIREHWDAIAQPVSQCLCGDEDRAEDVYAACVYGDAHLYVASDGFAVLRKRKTRKGLELRVWCAYCTGEKGALERYSDEIARIAREIGAHVAVFETRRMGFDRARPDCWKRAATVYEMEVPHV